MWRWLAGYVFIAKVAYANVFKSLRPGSLPILALSLSFLPFRARAYAIAAIQTDYQVLRD